MNVTVGVTDIGLLLLALIVCVYFVFSSLGFGKLIAIARSARTSGAELPFGHRLEVPEFKFIALVAMCTSSVNFVLLCAV
jgi:hypothetical protein